MPAPVKKKASQEKRPAVKKKVVSAASKKRSPKSSGSPKKTAASPKKGKNIRSPHKTAAKKSAPQKTVQRATAYRKTETSGDRLRDLKKYLISKKENILREAKEEIAKYISGENKQLVDTAVDDGDWALVDISEDINLQRLSSHRKLLHNIDEAIRKITDGTYGICEECGEEISEKRLLVLPTATLCIDCQENKEQFELLENAE